MTVKSLSLLSVVLTVALLVLLGIVVLFFSLIAMNGFHESQATPALITLLACQGAGVMLSAVSAGRLARMLAERWNWRKFIAAAAAVTAGTLLGGVLAAAAFVISLLVGEGLR